MAGVRIIQFYSVDKYGCKRIHDRAQTDMAVEEWLRIRHHRVWDGEKFIVTPGFEVEELPLPTTN